MCRWSLKRWRPKRPGRLRSPGLSKDTPVPFLLYLYCRYISSRAMRERRRQRCTMPGSFPWTGLDQEACVFPPFIIIPVLSVIFDRISRGYLIVFGSPALRQSLKTLLTISKSINKRSLTIVKKYDRNILIWTIFQVGNSNTNSRGKLKWSYLLIKCPIKPSGWRWA